MSCKSSCLRAANRRFDVPPCEIIGVNPYILAETDDFAVVFKPPRMHSASVRSDAGIGDTLLDWYAGIFPPVMELSGRKAGEGGLLHRLDYETQGLVLFAKNQRAFDSLLTQQAENNFVKEYSAICQKSVSHNSSFPPPPFSPAAIQSGCVIESWFRPYGPGRKQVRPVVEQREQPARDDRYRTEIINVAFDGACYIFTVRLRRGFRHQIRCHLAWTGYPIVNDPLYGEGADDGFLALRATGLTFTDPQSGKPVEYRVDPLEI